MAWSSPMAELQKIAFDALTTDPAVMAIADGVYDSVPPAPFEGPNQSYVRFGPHQSIIDDAECIIGGEHYLQIDCWSRKNGDVHVKRLVDTVCRTLHLMDVSPIEDQIDNAVVLIEIEDRQTMRDNDGLTSHGVITLRALIEEIS